MKNETVIISDGTSGIQRFTLVTIKRKTRQGYKLGKSHCIEYLDFIIKYEFLLNNASDKLSLSTKIENKFM